MNLTRAFQVFAVALFLLVADTDSWRRRRRRRCCPPPPPEPFCIVSDWTSWSQCSQQCSTGTQERTRVITYYPSPHCQQPNLREQQTCGAVNGGCQEMCDPTTGICSCRTGYKLASDGKNCQDIDECQPNGGRGPCSHLCTNLPGSHSCSCPTGYILGADGKTCKGKDCLAPHLPFCYAPIYSDHLGAVCQKVTVSCPSGTRYNAQCQFTCPQNFAIAKITNFDLPFAKEVSRSNFQNVVSSTTCVLDATGNPVWSNVNHFRHDYFCRRLNDPPSDIILSKNTLLEHSPIGTLVGTFSVRIPDTTDGITYNLQQSAGEYFFQLQGNMLRNTWVPRWNNLQGLKINDYRIVVRATDNGSPPLWLDKSFNITVINVNDPPYLIRISNNSVMDTATLGHVVGVLSAVDYDGPRGNLRSSDFIWTLIDNDKGRFGLQGPNVVVASALDHQAHQYHRIIVNCTDKDAANPRWVQVSIVINVIDTNDSPKNIRFTPYNLYENATAGFVAGDFVASDEDGDVLAFSLAQSDSDTLQTFELGRTSCRNKTVNGINHAVCTASLILKQSIDYETKNSYSVKITASDPSGSFVLGDFTVHVTNLNEAPTDITLSKDTVPENSPVGTFVGQLTISDPDTSQRSPQGHVCSVAPSKPFGINGVNLVVTEDSLNYEAKTSYRIAVTCTDTGAPPLSFSKDFIIKVQDRNEKPEYLTLTRSSIQENAPIGSTVGQLLTRDPDLNTRSLTFQVKSPGNSPFEIGGASNKYLVTRSRLDYETMQGIDLLLSVTDDGGLSLEKSFKITIIDVNEAPTDILLTSTTLAENSPPGAVIGSITVIDPDFNSSATCQIISGDSLHLAISGLNLVAGNQRVDYEALGSSKTLFVSLRCSDEFRLFTDKSFHIDVTDVNEPPTAFDVTLYSIPENKKNAVGGQLTIRDPDIGQTYSCNVVYNETESLLFRVDSATMMLKTRQPLNFEKQRQHLVTVRCSEQVSANYSQFTIFKDMILNVTDVNESPANPCPHEIFVDEAASNGYVIWTFQPYDPDNEKYEKETRLGLESHPKQLLTVSMTSPGPSFPFKVAGEKYIVKTGTVDRSVKDVYDLPINVTDDGMLVRLRNNLYERYQGPVISAQYTCRVRILASGDHRLTLDIALSSNTIPEDALNGTKIGTLSVINPNAGKTYRFAVVHPEVIPFRIVGNDLILVTGVPLDYETTNSTGVGVLVVDSDGTTVQRLFEIRITNVNERPIKMCLSGNKTVKELTNTDQIIGKIFIEDEDHKESKGICDKPFPSLKQSQNYTCEIESNIIDTSSVKQDFYVDKNLVVHGNTTFNYKAKSQYLVPLMCRDILKPIHIIELTVTINVQASAVKPVWDFTLSSNTISEDAANGTEIGTLTVVNGPSSSYTFLVTDARKPFRVVGTKLVLVYNQPLDYETSNSTTVAVLSTNSEGVRVTKSFVIHISNVDERPVNLCLLDFIPVIPEKSPSKTEIGRIAIEDPDHPESKDICKKNRGPVQYHTYTCSIYSNSASVVEVKSKFYIDQNFQLNRKGDLDYKVKSVYNIPIMCRDKLKPIHLIEKTFIVRIEAPSCQTGYKLVNGVCVCANGLSGPKCDRDPTICSKTICASTDVCVSHFKVANRCIPKVNQVPVLMLLPYPVASRPENRYKIEGYLESIFEGRRQAGQTLNSLFDSNVVSRRRREIPKDVYVEGAAWLKVLSFHTYTVFVAMDPQLNYKALPGSNLCDLLKGTDLRCVNKQDCLLLKQAGIDCPYKFDETDGNAGNKGKSKGGNDNSSSTEPVIYGVVSVGVIIIIIAILVFIVLRRRQRKRKSDEPVYYHDMQDDVTGMDNPTYGGVSPDHSPQVPPPVDRNLIFRNNMNNQASSRRPNNIKTFNNKLFNNPIYDSMANPPPPRDDEHLYASVGKRLGKDTVNEMLAEEKAKAREKGFDADVVALPNGQKGKWEEPEYASAGKIQPKQDNRKFEEIAAEKARAREKGLEGDVVALPKSKQNGHSVAPDRKKVGKPRSHIYTEDWNFKSKKDKDSSC